jgi:predicted  nucleic acid-binding Zn-ribbon protein
MAENILKLRVDSAEYDSKIQRAASGLQHFVKACHDQGDVIGRVVGETKKYIQSMGNMETVAKNSKGKLNELTAAYTEIRMVYKNLSDEEKRAPFGKELNKQLEIMKGRIDTLKQDLNDVNKELNPSVTSGGLNTQLGDLNGILSQVGGQIGINTSMLSGLTTGTMGYAAAVAAVVKVEYEAVKAFKEYNDELARQNQITGVTTGLKGADAGDMTAAARALSKVYGADFREVINAANTLMTQFGTDGASAINLIRQGMQGMIIGDAPKLLSMIQQYAPSFRDAGIEASQLVAIIQNSEGGIFSAENMNAIVMGIKNIRLMTKATSDALAEIGIDGKKMSQELNYGTITIFDALRKVSKELENTESGSQQAGQVMQQVFGRQGTMAGTNLAKAIATLNINLEETKTQTGEVGKSFDKLAAKTEELDKALMSVLQVESWDALKNNIESGFVGAMTKCVNLLGEALDIVNHIGDAFGGPVVQAVADFLVALTGPIGLIYEAYNLLKGDNGNTPKTETQEEKAQRIATGEKGIVANINSSKDKAGAYAKNMARLNKTLEKYQKEGNEEKAALTQRIIEIVEEHMDKTFGDYGKSGKKFKPVVKPTKGDNKETIIPDSIGDYEKQIADLRKTEKDVTTNEEWEALEHRIGKLVIKVKELKGELKDVPASISDVAEATNKATDAQNKKIQDRLNDPETVSKGMAAIIKEIESKNKKENKEEKKYLSDGLNKLAGGLGGIDSGFKSLGIDLGDGFEKVVGGLQGVSSILTGIEAIVAAIKIISTADALTPFFAGGGVVHAADGYMVPGNTYSGDMIPAALNAGEVVLNRAQAGILASDITSNGARNINVSGRLEGETIVLAADRWGKRTGKGELVFWK